MCNNKETLVIIYRSLLVGGIENDVVLIMRNALKAGKRVIWVCNTEKIYSPTYSDVVECNQLEVRKINFSGFDIYRLPQFDFSEGENVKVIVFDVFRLFQAYKIRQKYKDVNIDVFYCIPHFTGSTILPHQAFSAKRMRSIVKRKYSKIYNDTFKAGNLFFYSSTHYQVIQEEYGIKFKSPDIYMVPHLEYREEYDEESFKKVYRSGIFTIISPGRFEFPHKGYLIGLIKTYAELKPLYPQLRLLIIGDGPDKNIVEKIIQELPEDSRQDIIIQKPKTLDELKSIMKTVNLNISVAGCASLGARMGLITLPARHYVYDCEVYGFFPHSRTLTTESRPGFPVREYIEKVINMKETEYLQYSKMAYHTFDDEIPNANFPFIGHRITNYIPSRSDFNFVKWTYNMQRLKYLIERFKK